MLYAAAGEVERLQINEEAYGGFSNRGLLVPPARKPSPNLDVSGFYTQQLLSHNKLRTTHVRSSKQSFQIFSLQGINILDFFVAVPATEATTAIEATKRVVVGRTEAATANPCGPKQRKVCQ